MSAAQIIGLLCTVLIMILVSKVNIRIIYNKETPKGEFFIIVSVFFGLIRFKRKFDLLQLIFKREPSLKKESLRTLDSIDYIKTIFRYIHEYAFVRGKARAAFSYIRPRIYIKKLKWHTVFGVGDAAETGILTGLMWNIKTLLTSTMAIMFKGVSIPDLKIVPYFNETVFSTKFDCILSIRIGHAIIASIIFLITDRKDGDIIERAPYRSTYENHDGEYQRNG